MKKVILLLFIVLEAVLSAPSETFVVSTTAPTIENVDKVCITNPKFRRWFVI